MNYKSQQAGTQKRTKLARKRKYTILGKNYRRNSRNKKGNKSRRSERKA